MQEIESFVEAFYEKYEESGYCMEEDQELPPKDVLTEVCQTLLHVSCMREEGRYSRFRVCFLTPESGFLEPYIYAHALRFETPVAFTPKALYKLAPALNADMSYLMLDISEKPYKAVGVISAYTTWEKIMKREITRGIRMPRIPNILVSAPEYISACFGETSLVAYRYGECMHFRTDVFTSTIIADQLARGSHIKLADMQKLIYPLLWLMHAMGHGGLLFIVPSAEQCEEFATYKYRMYSRFPAHLSGSDCGIPDEHNTREISTYATLIAQLTLVDGGVILTKDMELIGFGAEVHSERIRKRGVKMRFIRYDGTEDNTRRFNDYGMRHRSCYNFCYDVDGAVGIIVSQDGVVEVCTREKDRIVVYDNVGLPLL